MCSKKTLVIIISSIAVSLVAVLVAGMLLLTPPTTDTASSSAPSSSQETAADKEEEGSEQKPEEEEEQEETPPCDHEYTSKVTKKSTATVQGTLTYTCSLCNDSYTEKLPTEIKILAVGNSFSDDGMEYLWHVLTDAGVEKVTLGNLYIGGCTVDMHWNNIQNDAKAYSYRRNTDGEWITRTDSLKNALLEEEWDVITVQQVSHLAGKPESMNNLHNVVEYLNENKTNPNAKFLWHMTWAYQKTSRHSGFLGYNMDQMTMYNAIVSTAKGIMESEPLFEGYIPCGTAIQNLRTTKVGDTLTRDGHHSSLDYGRYTLALTWMTAITGISPEKVDWVPSQYDYLSADDGIIDQAVLDAINTPDAVTSSNFTE